MKRYFLIIFSCLLFSIESYTQSSDTLRFSLVEAINHAINNNPQLKSTELNEENNKLKIKEVRSSALPQINATGTATDNFARASQLLPGEIFGQPGKTIATKFGTQFVYGGSFTLTQTLFNPSLNIGMKAAKESQGLYELQSFKSREELIYNVVNEYLQLQMAKKQRELYEGNIDRMKRLVEITNAQYKEGVIKKVDVTQLRVNYTNLETQLSNTDNSINQTLNNLKLLLNLDAEQPIAITEVGAAAIALDKQLFLDANTDLNILDKQILLQELNTKNIKAGYLPTLSLGANYGRQWQTNQLFNGAPTTGMTAGSYSLNLNIPIFDGNKRKHQISQSGIAVKQLQLNKEYLGKSINSQFNTAINNVNQNKKVSQAQLENMKLAEELYDVAKLSYTEGITPLSELINAENGLKEAQSQYLTATLQTSIAELNMMQSSGQLSQLIKAVTNKK